MTSPLWYGRWRHHQWELLEAALRIAEGGGRPLPCKYGGKTPVPIHGMTDAATARDPVAFARHWWGKEQLYNLGECTGARFDVLDIDDHYEGNGFAAFSALKAAGLLAGAFRVVKTPSGGGMHIYFAGSGQRGGSLKKLHLDFKASAGSSWCRRRRSAGRGITSSTSGPGRAPRSTGTPASGSGPAPAVPGFTALAR